jgi:MEDS: MEthanogen/methylotroph, DcmR Sensory domain
MIFILRRNSQSYFQSYKNYFIAIYLAFLAFPAGGLLFTSSLPIPFQKISIQAIITSGALIAIIWGYVATRLYVYPESLSPRRLFSRPFRPIFLVFALYLLPMILALADGWADPGSILPNPILAMYPLDNSTLPSTTISTALVGIGGAVVVAFTSYPLAVLSRRRALVKDKEVRHALKVIATVFGAISATLMTGFAALAYGVNILGPSNFVSVVLIIVAVQAFQKPTFLKAFLEVVPSLQSSPSATHFDQVILLHGSGDDKFSPMAKFIAEGMNMRERVVYFHDGDVTLVSEGLSREGLDFNRMMVRGSLRVLPLGSAYLKRGEFDDTTLQVIQELSTEAKNHGEEGLRVVLDYDNFPIRPIQKFAEHLMDPRWTSPDHHIHVLMVFDSTAFRGEEASLAKLEKKIRTVDLTETKDAFSQEMGLPRDEITGKKLLLQYDPQDNYEQVLKSLLAETSSNFERIVVFSRRDSALYLLARRQPGTKIFLLTSRVSYPKMESDNLYLLPSYDTSLVLDALNKTIEAYAGTPFTIIFDNISHFVFTIGPERTYSLVRQALELMVSNTITAVFSMNSQAHDQRIISTFQNMFDIEIKCKSGRPPQITRKIVVGS